MDKTYLFLICISITKSFFYFHAQSFSFVLFSSVGLSAISLLQVLQLRLCLDSQAL